MNPSPAAKAYSYFKLEGAGMWALPKTGSAMNCLLK